MKKRRRLGLAIGGFLGFGLVLVAVFFSEGILRFHYPSRSRYPVRGVDVSAHQGEIDWSVLAGQDVQFAYIKATEGSGFTDRMFADNWEGARRSGLRVGAYHFFSFDSGGDTQADRFIGTVPKEKDSLPPAVDVEFYGEKAKTHSLLMRNQTKTVRYIEAMHNLCYKTLPSKELHREKPV